MSGYPVHVHEWRLMRAEWRWVWYCVHCRKVEVCDNEGVTGHA